MYLDVGKGNLSITIQNGQHLKIGAARLYGDRLAVKRNLTFDILHVRYLHIMCHYSTLFRSSTASYNDIMLSTHLFTPPC